jgi:hypothetical protein
MPNWCHNTLSVQGSPDELKAFAEKVEMTYQDGSKAPLTFTVHAPMPEFPEDADVFTDGWYGWALNNWGTKWDAQFAGPMVAFGADGMDVDKSTAWNGSRLIEDELVFKFDTAWSPPYAWLQQCSEQEPHLVFSLRWAEVGNGLAAEATFCAGVMTAENEDLEVEDVLEPEEMWF